MKWIPRIYLDHMFFWKIHCALRLRASEIILENIGHYFLLGLPVCLGLSQNSQTVTTYTRSADLSTCFIIRFSLFPQQCFFLHLMIEFMFQFYLCFTLRSKRHYIVKNEENWVQQFLENWVQQFLDLSDFKYVDN